ncbi:MAG: sterol desaturase family protein [Chromatiales bacterium]|jgi:sterol desaturase/sphingolipid hydroxylase (fatty acid hydroxylase superfamily)
MRNNLSQDIRLFRNDFLESLTHVHPILPLVVWSPLVAVLLWRSLFVHDLALLPILGWGLLGLFVWTLTEYLAHRFLFHFPAKGRIARQLVFLFHGVHHDAPQDKTRLVMPPAGAAILAVLFYGAFSLVIPSPWIEPFFAFWVVGYLIYDYIHYATHHFRMSNRIGRFLKRYHMQHHFQRPDGHFGVSSPLWDHVFRTR